MRTVAVLGAGNMGTALAQVIAVNGHSVHLWSIEPDVLEEMRDSRTNSKYLPGVSLHERVTPNWTLEEALADAWLAVFAVPSQGVRTLARQAAPHLRVGHTLLHVAKGMDEGSEKRMSEVLAEELPHQERVAFMGGPAIAGEFVRGVPSALIAASADGALADEIRETFQNDFFKVETTTDIVGAELGGCLKNVYAIALGMSDGLGHGGNTKAFLATLAMDEMAALFRTLGGDERTAYGLAGLGDLLATGFNARSRNRTLGERLCNDPNWHDFLRTHTVEGVQACRTTRDLARRADVSTPLLDAIYDVLFMGEPPAETMRLFLRDFAYG